MRKRPDRIYEGRKPQAYRTRTARMNMVGSQIRQARLNRVPQWSLEELSQHLYQVTQLELGASTLSKIETGVRSIYDFEIYALARTLEVSLNWLFNLPEMENNKIELENF